MAGASGGLISPNNIRPCLPNQIIVDSADPFTSDTNGGRGIGTMKTLAAARAKAQRGDLITVMPGDYLGVTGTLEKALIYWEFKPGAVIVDGSGAPNSSLQSYLASNTTKASWLTSTLEGWYDLADKSSVLDTSTPTPLPITDGAKIGSIKDKGPHGRDLTSTSASRPFWHASSINGHPAMANDNTDTSGWTKLTIASAKSLTNFEVLCVCHPGTTADNRGILGGPASVGNYQIRTRTSGALSTYYNTGVDAVSTATITLSDAILGWSRNSTTTSFWRNAAAIGTPVTNSSNAFSWGTVYDYDDNQAEGVVPIGQLLVFSAELSTSVRAAWTNLFKDEYGIV